MAVLQTRERIDKPLSSAERVVAVVLPSMGDLVFVTVFVGVLLGLQGRLLGYDGDAAWNLRIGSVILAHGVPRTEFMLATTYGQPTIYYEWLAQLGYALALRFGGLNGVVALSALLIAMTGTLLFAAIRRRHVPVLLALLLTALGLALTTFTWTARAQLFSLVLTLWWSEWIWAYWHDGNARRLWAFPLVIALWANLHGGFIIGLLLLGTATAVGWLTPTRRGKANPRRLTLAFAGSLLAVLLTPWGVALPMHIVSFFRNPLISQYTVEFQSPNFHSPLPLLFLALVFALVGAWLWSLATRRDTTTAMRPRTIEPLALAHAAIWTALAIYTVRYIPIWALVVVPLLGEAVTTALRASWVATDPSELHEIQRRFASAVRMCLSRAQHLSGHIEATDALVGRGIWSVLAVVCVAVLVASAGTLPGTSMRLLDARFDAQAFPVQAAERLHREGLPHGSGFTTYVWGSYLDYALPEYHPFVDSRSDSYSAALLRDYLTITGLEPGWQQRLDHYHLQWALLPQKEPLAQVLTALPSWHCTPADDQHVAVLCVRRSAP